MSLMGGGGWVGSPCDFSVSRSPFGLDFGTLDLGLTISIHGHRSLTNSLRPTPGVGARQPYGVLVENLNRRQRYNLPTRITIF